MKSLLLHRNNLLASLYVLFVFIIPASCEFHRGRLYWSGRPQPIGIDFTYNAAYAVYADGPDNFTHLADTGPSPGNDYNSYVQILYNNRNEGDNAPFIASSYDDFPIEKWMFYALDYIPLLFSYYRRIFQGRLCVKFYETFSNLEPHEFYAKCRQNDDHTLRVRRSRYLPALIRQRMTWNWATIPHKPMTRSNFVLAIHSMLVELKRQAFQEHNITITSASISLPPWIFKERSELVDEACLLAGIEVIEHPHSNVDAATMSTNTTGAVLVLDFGRYYFNIYRSTRKMKEYEFGVVASAPNLAYTNLMYKLVHRIFARYIKPNATLVEIEDIKPGGWVHVTRQLNAARSYINYGTGWPLDFEMENRTIPIDVEMITGHPQFLNLTGDDVQMADSICMEEISRKIQVLLSRQDQLWEYMRTLPEYSPGIDYEDYVTLLSTIVETHPPPPPLTSWLAPVSKVLVLSSPLYAELLYKSAFKALGWLTPSTTPIDQQRQCVPSYQTAARGVALRAREWVRIYDSERDLHASLGKCHGPGGRADGYGCTTSPTYSDMEGRGRQGVLGIWTPAVNLRDQFLDQL